MGPEKYNSFLFTLSCFLKSMAPGFPDLEVPPTSLITTNRPLLIRLPNPIILFILNEFILHVSSASCADEYHNFIMCCVKKHFLSVLSFQTPCFDHLWVPSWFCIYFCLGWKSCIEGSLDQQSPLTAVRQEELQVFSTTNYQRHWCERGALTTKHMYCNPCQLPQLWQDPDF